MLPGKMLPGKKGFFSLKKWTFNECNSEWGINSKSKITSLQKTIKLVSFKACNLEIISETNTLSLDGIKTIFNLKYYIRREF